MKKLLSIILSITLILSSSATALATVSVSINNAPVAFTSQSGAPFIDQANRTQVPLRATMETFGCNVSWESETNTAKVSKDGTTVEVMIGQNYILKNNTKIAIDSAAIIKDGRTYLPIRAVLESFGANVSWNNTSQTVMVSSINGKVMTIHYLDVGQGDSIFIDYGNYEVLIDAGTAGYGAKVVNYIRPYIDGDLELVICTHIHADHIGGIPAVLAAFNVEMVIDSGEVGTTATWRNYMAAVDKEGCTFLVDKDMQIDIGENAWLNIYDIVDGDSDSNNNSVVAELDYSGFSALFTGDLDSKYESIVAERVGKKVDVFKAGHHGSNTANSQALLNIIIPSLVIISYGDGNTYGHPHQEPLIRFKSIGALVLGTAISGDITVSTSGQGYNITTSNTSRDTPVSPSANIIPVITPTQVSPIVVNPSTAGTIYIGNSNTKKFHTSTCSYVKSISPENKVIFSSRAAAIAQGYIPCKVCKP